MSDYGKSEGLTINQIALQQVKVIIEIGSHQLRDQTTQTINSNSVSIIEKEDTRESYCEAVENLAYLLLPFFDEKIKKHYNECIEILQAFGFEIRKKCKKQYEEICKGTGKENLGDNFYSRIKLRYAKRLFRELNLLLKRKDYLKTTSYGEDSSDDVIDDDGDEQE
jgi:hypothetical protein